MRRLAPTVICVLISTQALAPSRCEDKATSSAKKPADGVYAVLRDSVKESELLPLEAGETLLVNRHRYVKKDDQEPPRFLVVRGAPDVVLDLAEAPKAVKEGDEVVRIFIKLEPKAATALERLTTAHNGRHLAFVLGGEVVTMHKVREVIKGGEAQITSCTPGAANYLLERLQAHRKDK